MANARSRRGALAAWAALSLLLAGCAHEAPVVNPRVAQSSLTPVRAERTALVAFDTTPFPFHGTAPGAAHPFMNVNDNGRLGHASLRNGILWEDETYNDRRVLLSLPKNFDPRRPSAIVVFLHGNEATLQRDVVERQGVLRQLAHSGLNAALVAPQFAVNARDSSAGRFWEPGVFNRFLDEAGQRLADLYGTREAAFVFHHAPVILVGYSGGYSPAAAALRYGSAGRRIEGVVLLDALYGELPTFQSFIVNRDKGFFVSVYGQSSREGNLSILAALATRGIAPQTSLGSIGPGSVTFVDAGPAVPHNDFVTDALDGEPLADILSRIKGFPRGPGNGAVAGLE